MSKYLLIDGYNMAFRSYYGIRELSRSDGFATNAIHGWYKTISKLLVDESPECCIAFFDAGEDEARIAIHPDYKGNRSEMPDDLFAQIPVIQEFTRAMGITVVERPGVEADDVMASFALLMAERGHDVLMVSADKDFAQIVGGSIVQLVPPPTANPRVGWRRWDRQGVREKFGIEAEQVVDYLSLVGDNADNIPGIKGVGPKTAVKWLLQYGSIEGILASAEQVEPKRFRDVLATSQDLLALNQELIRFRRIADVSEIATIQGNDVRLMELLEEMEMKTTLAKKREQLDLGI